MKRFILTCAILALITSCKSSAFVAPIILKDSVSITYKQGTVQPLSIYKTEEQPSPSGLRGAQTDFRKNSCVPAAWCPRQTGKPYLGKGQTSTREASVSEEALSERTNKPAVPPTARVRVDTVFVERWHTEVCQPQAVCQRSGPSAEGGLSAKRSQFYKNCTLGFWVLLILLLGRIAFRIMKAIYLRR